MNTPADPDSLSLDREAPVTDQRDRCDACQVPLAETDAQLVGYVNGDAILAWAFCASCYELLVATVREELHVGPAWPSRSRKAEARVRRRDRARRAKRDPPP
jgi:hypothetical protein